MGTPEAKPDFYISASRLKLAQECSWKFFCRYILKLPDQSNDGARRGQICHKLFECLLNKRHIHHFNEIIRTRSIRSIPALYKFINWQIKKEGVSGEVDNKGNNNFDLIEEMILVGLNHDFFCEGKNLLPPETEFKFVNQKPYYALAGFIDKMAEKDGTVYIYDYKSSTEKFTGEDAESNLQAFMYSLYVQKIRKAKATVSFIFLRHEENPLVNLTCTDAQLHGFEHYLASAYSYLKNFSEADARANYAYNQPRPTNGEFKGPLCCGFAKFKGQKKKDGNNMFACSYKFDFEYYVVLDEKGAIIKSSFADDLKAEAGQKIEKRKYFGCPRFGG